MQVLRRPSLGKPLARLLQQPPSVPRLTGFKLVARGGGRLAMHASLRRHSAIGRRKGNLELIDLIPFGFRPLPLRNLKKLLQTPARRIG